MNKKLLEQRAEKYISKNYSNLNCGIQGIIKQSCIEFATEETKLLSEHILELQKTNGSLTDRVDEAREIIKTSLGLLSLFSSSNGSVENFINKAEQFLGDEK